MLTVSSNISVSATSRGRLLSWRMKGATAIFALVLLGASTVALKSNVPLPKPSGSDSTEAVESCYKGLYEEARDTLVQETEWRSYRDLIYASVRLEDFDKSNNTVQLVFAKSVVFFLIDPLMLKKMTTPLLTLFGLVYPSPTEEIKLSINISACANLSQALPVTDVVENVLELAAQRVASAIELSGTAAYYATVYNEQAFASRQPVFMAFFCLVLVCLSLASAGLVGKHVNQLKEIILNYAKSAHYHAFVVFSFILGSVLTMAFWLVWLFIVFVNANSWQGWLLLSALLIHLCCFVPAEIIAISHMNISESRRKNDWVAMVTEVPVVTSLVACIQFAAFLSPFLLLALLSWPLLTTASVLFAYSMSCCCYGGIVVVLLVAVVTISSIRRKHENCVVGTMIVVRDAVILGCAILAGMSATLILGYFLTILFNGTHQDTSNVLPFILSLLSTFGSTLIALSIHKLLFSMAAPVRSSHKRHEEDAPKSPLDFEPVDDGKSVNSSKYGALDDPVK